jgi:hypothetical protein
MKTTVRVVPALMILCCLSLPAAGQTLPIRIKAGGTSTYTDSLGHLWAADLDFNTSLVSATTGTVKGTADQALYQGGRMPNDTNPLIYTFTVPNGPYHVNLYFAELNTSDDSAGARMFNVKVQGTVVLQNFDIFAAAGAATALIKGIDFSVTNGSAQIELDNIAGHDRGKVCAIEILQNTPGPPLVLNFTYPDGTAVAGNLNYSVTAGSVTLGGQQPLTNGQVTCQFVTSPGMVGLTGQMTVTLSLTDSSSNTLWQLALTLNPTSTNFGSVQSSTLNIVVAKP